MNYLFNFFYPLFFTNIRFIFYYKYVQSSNLRLGLRSKINNASGIKHNKINLEYKDIPRAFALGFFCHALCLRRHLSHFIPRPFDQGFALSCNKSVGILCCLLGLILGGCSPSLPQKSPNPSPISTEELDLTSVLANPQNIAFINQNQLFLINTSTREPISVYTLMPDEIPLGIDIFELKISPTQKDLVWYSPRKGLIKLNLTTRTTTLLLPANQWLNKNPYFEFNHSGESVFLVDNQGINFHTITLDSGQITTKKIPEPFGNEFRSSPDNQHLLFISGFGQSHRPEFMFTDINMENPQRFYLDSLPNQRFEVVWNHDSTAIITLENHFRLVTVSPTQPQQKKLFFELEPNLHISQLHTQDNILYFFASDNKWRGIDMTTKQLLVRSPVEIAEDIHRPRFIPWHDKTFLIEETMRSDTQQYQRLWLSNPIGIKTLIIDRYLETTFENSVNSL